MFCQKCGKENSAGFAFCGCCGNNSAATASARVTTNSGASGSEMAFSKSIATCMSKYADFKGRAARPEYWWFYLFTLMLGWSALIVDHSRILSCFVNLALFLPSLAAATRRLHDTNRSGWWWLIVFTGIGAIPFIIWLARRGDDQANEYGAPV